MTKKQKILLEVIDNNKFQCIVKNNRYVIEKSIEQTYSVTEFAKKNDEWMKTGISWNATFLKELIKTFEEM
jgi:hypothetical protein